MNEVIIDTPVTLLVRRSIWNRAVTTLSVLQQNTTTRIQSDDVYYDVTQCWWSCEINQVVTRLVRWYMLQGDIVYTHVY